MPIVNLIDRTEEVMRDTWGHLAAKKGQTYLGFVLFSASPNGNWNILDFHFEGLSGNPWTYENVSAWWSEEINKPKYTSGDDTRFWRWEGTYREYKNGRFRLSGKATEMTLSPLLSKSRRV